MSDRPREGSPAVPATHHSRSDRPSEGSPADPATPEGSADPATDQREAPSRPNRIRRRATWEQPRGKVAPKPEPEPAVIPRRSRDEQDVGWGDQPASDERDADWYRRERPPHHGG